ncbi:MAG: PDGLE domain-containing protein [Candidatus Saganbacteria bacterium]|nr:PDGLE domain-containing protein [Candidatus Saganbacteria bacterium]
MKKLLLLSILIVILAAFFASAHPDGLEKVAEHLGFMDKGIERSSLMTDYSVSLVPYEGISTALAGIIGVFICLGLFWGAGLLLKKT